MAYLTSLLVVAGALLVLAALAVRLVGPARRATRSATALRVAAREGTGVLAARTAALRTRPVRDRSRGRDRSAV